ncbi:MAG: ABC transporter ATP-binding protein [Gemmatimonadetes bacterium]|nr:ABC transporter ATP-binding protein [Gemmatimonadota bacterium]
MSELRSVLPYVRPYRAGILAGLGLIVVSNGFGILVPWLIGRAIDSLYIASTVRTDLLRFAGLIIGAALLSGAARFGMRLLLNAISRRIETDLRDAFFSHLMRLDATFFGSIRTGDLMSRATNDLQAVRQAVGPGIMYLTNTIIGTAAALVFMLSYSTSLTLIALVPLAVLPFVMKYFGRVIHQKAERIQDHLGVLSSMVQENLTGVRIVRAYNQEEAQEEEFDELNREYLERNMALARTSAIFHPSLSVLTGLGLLAVLWFGGQQAIAGDISGGDFVAFIFYLAMLTWPMIALGWVINLFQRGAASMGRINRIMTSAPAVSDPVHAESLPTIRGDVEFRSVSFRYPGTDRWVLRDVSFRIHAGQTVALVGPTGAGKSTVIALLTRRYDATEGSVLIDGVPIERIRLEQLRSAIGVVPQDAFVFSDTIENNIALSVPDGAGRAEQVRWASDVAQLTDTIADFPLGFATRLGERGVNLSGGQRQRATLARAIARDPVILALDDALSAVDTHTEKRILAGLRDVMTDRTSIVVSHRVSAVMGADQILVLDEGVIAERGSHVDLLAADGVYARLLKRQLLEEGLEAGLEAEPLAAGHSGI